MNAVYLLELRTAKCTYEEKLKSNSTTDQTMFSLSWDIEELKNICSEFRKIYNDLTECVNSCKHELFHESNVPRKLTQIRQRMHDATKRILHFKREPATHIFVLMISSDARDKKPYALPIQRFSYAGINEADLRRIISELCKKMVSLGMKVSGILLYYISLFYLMAQSSAVMENLTTYVVEDIHAHCQYCRFIPTCVSSIARCLNAN